MPGPPENRPRQHNHSASTTSELSGDSDLGADEVAGFRQRTYFLLGSLFHYPRDDAFVELASVAEELSLADDRIVREFSFYGEWKKFIDDLTGAGDQRVARLREEYLELFQLNSGRGPCPLYESEYMTRTGRDKGAISARVTRSYAAGGFAVDTSSDGELPDHVGIELEFMSVLCAQELGALEAEGWADAASCASLQKSFLESHLGAWVPQLADRLLRDAQDISLYYSLATLARAFVAHDSDLVAELERSYGGMPAGEDGSSGER